MLGLGRDDIISDGHGILENSNSKYRMPKKSSITYVEKNWGEILFNLYLEVKPIFFGCKSKFSYMYSLPHHYLDIPLKIC